MHSKLAETMTQRYHLITAHTRFVTALIRIWPSVGILFSAHFVARMQHAFTSKKHAGTLLASTTRKCAKT